MSYDLWLKLRDSPYPAELERITRMFPEECLTYSIYTTNHIAGQACLEADRKRWARERANEVQSKRPR